MSAEAAPAINGSWERVFQSPYPGLKRSSAWAYDDIHNVIILFGGIPNAAQTWVYHLDTETWERKFPEVSPPPRAVHQMTFDSGNGVAVIFGGYRFNGHGTELADTWVYDYETNTWYQIFTPTRPPARHYGALIYDPVNEKVVLFGGHLNRVTSEDTMYSDTWVLDVDERTWTQKFPSTQPSARQTFPIYNEKDGLIYIFGGKYETSTVTKFYNDMWSYNLATNTWTMIMDDSDSEDKPSNRRTKWTYDPINNYGVLFSGAFTPSIPGDTWIFDFDITEWSKVTSPLPNPVERYANLIIRDPINDKILMYGGIEADGTILGDIWHLTYPDKDPSGTDCFGQQPSITGTVEDDILYGTEGDDIIFGGDGNDTIRGLGGNDLICGGEGDDSLYGGEGNDRISGGNGNDMLHGTDNEDQLLGDAGNDSLYGGSGVDVADGGSETDTCFAEQESNCEV
jgi:hypothetical protein